MVRSTNSYDATLRGSSEGVEHCNTAINDNHITQTNNSTTATATANATATVNAILRGEGDVNARISEIPIKSERNVERKLERKNSLYQQLTEDRKEQLGNERVKSLMLQNKDREDLCKLNIVNTRKGSTKALQNELVSGVKEEKEVVEVKNHEVHQMIEKEKCKEKEEKVKIIEVENEKKIEDITKYPNINTDKKKEITMICRKSIDKKYSVKTNTRMTNYLFERADSIRMSSRSLKRINSDLDSIVSDLTEDEENERDLVKKIEMKFIEIGKRIIEVHNRQNSLNDTCKKEFVDKERKMKLINDKKLANIGKNSCHKDSVKNRKTRNNGFSFRAATPIDEIQVLKNIIDIKVKEDNILRGNIDVEKRSRLKIFVEDEKIRKKEFEKQIRKVNEKGAEQVKDLGNRLDLCRKRAEEKNRKNRSDIEKLLRGLGHLNATLEKQRKTKDDNNTECDAGSSSIKRYSSSIEISSNRVKSRHISKTIDNENIFFTKKTDSFKRNSEIHRDDALYQNNSHSVEILLGMQKNKKSLSKHSIFKKSVYEFFTRKETPFFKWLK